jgi:transposase
MITVPAGVRIYSAMGPTDMRKGFDGLSLLEQEQLRKSAGPGPRCDQDRSFLDVPARSTGSASRHGC